MLLQHMRLVLVKQGLSPPALKAAAAVRERRRRPATATAAAATACWPAAAAAAGIMLVTGTRAFFHYNEAEALGKRKICYEKISNVTRNAWEVAFDKRLCMAWIRLTGGANPADFSFVDTASQRKWDRFITKYREANPQASSNGAANARYILLWIDEQRKMLRTLRSQLDM